MPSKAPGAIPHKQTPQVPRRCHWQCGRFPGGARQAGSLCVLSAETLFPEGLSHPRTPISSRLDTVQTSVQGESRQGRGHQDQRSLETPSLWQLTPVHAGGLCKCFTGVRSLSVLPPWKVNVLFIFIVLKTEVSCPPKALLLACVKAKLDLTCSQGTG